MSLRPYVKQNFLIIKRTQPGEWKVCGKERLTSRLERVADFLEALGEASTKMNNWSLGAIVRFDVLHTDRTRDFNVDGVSRQADIKFDRRNWILGGKIGFVF